MGFAKNSFCCVCASVKFVSLFIIIMQDQPVLSIEEAQEAIKALLRRFKSDDCLEDLKDIRAEWLESNKSDEASESGNTAVVNLLMDVEEEIMVQFGFSLDPSGHDAFNNQLLAFESENNPAFDELSGELKEFYDNVREICDEDYSDSEEESDSEEDEPINETAQAAVVVAVVAPDSTPAIEISQSDQEEEEERQEHKYDEENVEEDPMQMSLVIEAPAPQDDANLVFHPDNSLES